MKKKKNVASKIVKTEVDFPIHCPFCNQLIRDDDEDGEYFINLNACEHLIFEACDDGFEFRSERFNKLMNLEPADGKGHDGFLPEDEDGFYNIDKYTDEISIPGSVKYANYEGFTSYGIYYGFAPSE